jgi:hypothetical protein
MKRMTGGLAVVVGLLVVVPAWGHGDGHDDLPDNRVTITEREGFRYITSNGIPDHEPGRFPNRGNPNTISEQTYDYRMPIAPTALAEPVPMRGYLFGVALNGVPFDPGTAEIWTPQGRRMRGQARDYGWNYDALSGKIDLGIDEHHAHVQPTGAYHYHGLPTGLIEHLAEHRKEAGEEAGMILVGYAADGFPIYARFGYKDADDPASALIDLKSSYRLKNGERTAQPDGPGGKYDGTYVQDFEYVEGAGDLDECNGRFGVTPEYPGGTYYYVLTETYPFVPRDFRGEPDASFHKGHGPRRHAAARTRDVMGVVHRQSD